MDKKKTGQDEVADKLMAEVAAAMKQKADETPDAHIIRRPTEARALNKVGGETASAADLQPGPQNPPTETKVPEMFNQKLKVVTDDVVRGIRAHMEEQLKKRGLGGMEGNDNDPSALWRLEVLDATKELEERIAQLQQQIDVDAHSRKDEADKIRAKSIREFFADFGGVVPTNVWHYAGRQIAWERAAAMLANMSEDEMTDHLNHVAFVNQQILKRREAAELGGAKFKAPPLLIDEYGQPYTFSPDSMSDDVADFIDGQLHILERWDDPIEVRGKLKKELVTGGWAENTGRAAVKLTMASLHAFGYETPMDWRTSLRQTYGVSEEDAGRWWINMIADSVEAGEM